jgi:hypothetical protein
VAEEEGKEGGCLHNGGFVFGTFEFKKATVLLQVQCDVRAPPALTTVLAVI